MIIEILVLVLCVTGFLAWVFWTADFDGAFIVAFCALSLELIFAVAVVPTYLLESYTCSQVAEKLEVEHDYDLFTGCFVKDADGRWYNYDQMRIVK